MNEINNKELYLIVGGLSISGSIVNAFTNGIKIVLEVGRSFGTSIRRIVLGKLCNV